MTTNAEFLALCIATALLFGALVFFGTKASTKRQHAALRDTTGRNVFERVGQAFPVTDLLYGIWQIGMTEVGLIGKDCNDLSVGTVVKQTFSTSIELDNSRFDLIPGATWNKTSELVAHDSGEVRARFERIGSLLRPEGKYSLDNGRILTLRKNFVFDTLVRIYDGQEQVGWVRELQRGAVRIGRALSLPNSIPTEVKLFILSEVIGTQRR